MRTLRALVDVAGGMIEAVSAEERLARSLAASLTDHLLVTATVWLAPAGGGPLALAVTGHEPVVGEELAARVQDGWGRPDPSLSAGQPMLAPCDGRPAVIVPMWTSSRLVGAVAVTRDPGEPEFAEDDLAFVQAIADIAAVTLVNARLLGDSTALMEDLRRQNELMDHISDALIACDADGRIVSWNAGAEAVYGYPRAEALGCDLFALLATHFFATDGQALDAADVLALAATGGGWQGEVRERRADGLPVTILSSIDVSLDGSGAVRSLVLVNRDVTDQRREEHRALHDALTGLPNRRMLINRLYDAFARACRAGTPLAVLYIDVGNGADEVLRVLARRFSHVLRYNDVVARVDGDGFVAVLERPGTEDAVTMVADRIAGAVAEPFELSGSVVQVRATIGAVLVDGADGLEVTPEQLVEAADRARHLARAAGVRFQLERLSPLAV